MNMWRTIFACAAVLAVTGHASAQAIDDPRAEPDRNAVRSAIMQQRAAPFGTTHFRLFRGNPAPANISIFPLPPEVTRLYPQWRGYSYFVAGDQIAIVDPNTRLIVSLLPA
ncbi:MAG TPA: DUF1236 domain-containing protein [Xanthobacteraceae bacterium]|nr:DUF1236 domain-containing protein [Xanthobacteraceae bacterium]